jgi:hypothetical protein
MTTRERYALPAEPPAVMNVREAADYLRISVRSMQRLTAEAGASGLPVVYVTPKRRVFRRADLDRYLARRAVA